MKRFFLACASVLFLTPCFSQSGFCVDAKLIKERGDIQSGQGVYNVSMKWTPGSTITVSFLGGSAWQQEQVKKYAVEWSNYGNVSFQFLTFGTGTIRVSFDPAEGSKSRIGTDAKNVIQSMSTMNLGWIEPEKGSAEIRRVILHEFGHALGLLHEHSNPESGIKWNEPYVKAYCKQAWNWTSEMVEYNIFYKYNETMTNRKYDRYSIMHYHFPKEFTENNIAMDPNYDFSSGDKELIRELYPPAYKPVERNTNLVSCLLKDSKIEHNVTENGRIGMRVSQSFSILNAQNTQCLMAIHIYSTDTGEPLKDKNQLFKSVDGKVATHISFTPPYQNSVYTDQSLFFPYDEFDVEDGEYRLKLTVTIFDGNKNAVATGGFQYLTYRKGITCSEMRLETLFSYENQSLTVYPIFVVNNAKGIACTAALFFYGQDGTLLKDFNNLYKSPDGYIAVYRYFTPPYDGTVYNSKYEDFSFVIPYTELHLLKGLQRLKYKVVLYDSNLKPFFYSNFMDFSLNVN